MRVTFNEIACTEVSCKGIHSHQRSNLQRSNIQRSNLQRSNLQSSNLKNKGVTSLKKLQGKEKNWKRLIDIHCNPWTAIIFNILCELFLPLSILLFQLIKLKALYPIISQNPEYIYQDRQPTKYIYSIYGIPNKK